MQEDKDRPLRRKEEPERFSPAGPHEKPELTNDEATPGAGSLPSNRHGQDVDSGTG